MNGKRCRCTVVADQILCLTCVKVIIRLLDIVDNETIVGRIDLHSIAWQLSVLATPLDQRTRITVDHALKANAIADLRRHILWALNEVRFYCGGKRTKMRKPNENDFKFSMYLANFSMKIKEL